MAMYDFVCEHCGYTFEEIINTYKTDGTTAGNPLCPKCGEPVHQRLFPTNTNFHLKGTGWYTTDYKNTKKD